MTTLTIGSKPWIPPSSTHWRVPSSTCCWTRQLPDVDELRRRAEFDAECAAAVNWASGARASTAVGDERCSILLEESPPGNARELVDHQSEVSVLGTGNSASGAALPIGNQPNGARHRAPRKVLGEAVAGMKPVPRAT
ncbi:MAG: hypothetical protein U1F23_12395 [Lysobacterales bacterium]